MRVVPQTAGAISGTTILTVADSGGTFSIAKQGVYQITLPAPAVGMNFTFIVSDGGLNIVTIASTGANMIGVIDIANVSTNISVVGTNILSASGAGIGDWVEFKGISETKYFVRGACVAAAKWSVT